MGRLTQSAQGESVRSERELEALYERFAADVYAYALRRVSRSLADDVVSDVFLVAWRRIGAVPEAPLPWLLGVARNVISNHARGERRRGALIDRIEREPPRLEPVDTDDDRVGAAFRRLSPADREVLTLLAWEDLSTREAAAALNCSDVAFRVRLHRARRRFSRAMESSHDVKSEQHSIPGHAQAKGTIR